MVPKLNETECVNLSLRRRVRRFWIEEKRLAHIGRSVAFHVMIALPLEALLLWLGVPALCAIIAAVTTAVTVEVVSRKSKTENEDN